MQRRHLLAFGVLVAAVGFLLLPATGLAGGSPSIAWSPSTWAYGTVSPGQTASHTFTLTNSKSAGSSTGALSISIGGSDAAAFSITSNTCNGVALGKGKSCAVIVQFAPTTAGQTYSATLAAKGKKPAGGTATASLSGSGTPQTGAIRVTKVASGTTTGLQGAHFTVDGTGDYQTGSDGTFCIAGLTIGNHTVTETTPPPGYDLASPASQTVNVASAGTCASGSTAATATFEDPRTNLVPNPGFETDCSGIPCHWAGSDTDSANPHSGSASINVTDYAVSDCFTVSPDTTYNISGWYRMTDNYTPIIGINEFADSDCTATDGSFGPPSSPLVFTDTWTQLSGSLTTLSVDVSAEFFVEIQCASVCSAGTSANFDDVSLTQAP